MSALALVVLAACAEDEPDAAPATTTSRPAVRASSTSTAISEALADLPEPRTEVAGVALGDRIVVAGGLNADGTASTRADEWVAGVAHWERLPPLPTPRHHSVAVALGGRVYLIGGYTNDRAGTWRELDSVISIQPGERRWQTEVALRMPRGAPGATATADQLVVFGGVSAGQVVATTELWRPGAERWDVGPPLEQRREHTAAAFGGGRVYAIGGRVASLESNLTSVESLDPANLTAGWREEPALSQSRGGIAAATVNDRPCVAGGEEPSGTIDTVECLMGTGWQVRARLREPRHGLAVVSLAGKLHVIAGGPKPGLFVSGTHEAFAV